MAIKTFQTFSAPNEPDTIYTHPELSNWLSGTQQNRNITKEAPCYWRYREELIAIAIDYTRRVTGIDSMWNTGNPVITTGHQPNWHHCGIFVKSAIGHQMAYKTGGLFVHVILDHDIVDLTLSLPHKAGDALALLDYGPARGQEPNVPMERLQLHQEDAVNLWTEFKSIAPENASVKIVHGFSSTRNSHCTSFSDCIVNQLSTLYCSLGINAVYLPVSQISESLSFQSFCTSIFPKCETFINDYNTAVSVNGSYAGISKLTTTSIHGRLFTELPLWLLTPRNTRSTLFASVVDTSIEIACDNQIIGHFTQSDPHLLFQTLKQQGFSIRPKAVLLTLFLRLYLCDWFIHGTGGSRYERISDYLLMHFWDVRGLSYGIASMTSHLFAKECAAAQNVLSFLQNQRRTYMHTPERLLAIGPQMPMVNQLIQEKLQLISCSRSGNLSSLERNTSWHKLKEINWRLQSLLPFSEEDFLINMNLAKEQLRILQKRDFFFGLFPKQYLQFFIEMVNAEL